MPHLLFKEDPRAKRFPGASGASRKVASIPSIVVGVRPAAIIHSDLRPDARGCGSGARRVDAEIWQAHLRDAWPGPTTLSATDRLAVRLSEAVPRGLESFSFGSVSFAAATLQRRPMTPHERALRVSDAEKVVAGSCRIGAQGEPVFVQSAGSFRPQVYLPWPARVRRSRARHRAMDVAAPWPRSMAHAARPPSLLRSSG